MIKLDMFQSEIDNFMNDNPKIEVRHVSGIEQWNFDNPAMPINLKEEKGILFLFLTAALFNYGGGGPGRLKQLKNLYPIIYKKNFRRSKAFKNQSTALKNIINSLENFLSLTLINSSNPLKDWWRKEKKSAKNDLEKSAINIILKIQSIKFDSNRKKSNKSVIMQKAFTSKAFLIARELHATNIWPDFPLNYCYVPDINMVQKIIQNKFNSNSLHLFLISEFLHNEMYNSKAPILYDWPLLPRRRTIHKTLL